MKQLLIALGAVLFVFNLAVVVVAVRRYLRFVPPVKAAPKPHFKLLYVCGGSSRYLDQRMQARSVVLPAHRYSSRVPSEAQVRTVLARDNLVSQQLTPAWPSWSDI